MGKVKNFFFAVGRWFKNHAPTRRRIIQVYAALLNNANLKGFGEGQIYTGATKNVCTPGLNCYSCPGAVAACPLGALQNSLGSSGTTTPYYILGIIALFGVALGRTICGFLCPFGLTQDLLYKVKSPKLKKSAYTRILSYLKYLLLIVLVIAVPLIYHNVPAFCKYICPAGTFEGSVGLLANSVNTDLYAMLGYLFSWKFALFVCFVVACIFIYRAFCRFICPLGAIYGFFNRIALLGVKLDKSKCIDCGMCISKCKMDIRHVGDHECINCGECISVCPTHAISWKGGKLFVEPVSMGVSASEAPATVKVALSSIISSGTTMPVTGENAAIAEDVSLTNQTESNAGSANGDVVLSEETTRSEILPEKTERIDGSSAPSMQKVRYVRKKSSKILEAVAWSLAGALLIAALVYYNIQPSANAAFGNTVENFSARAYDTAYAEESYTLYENNDKPTVLVFWSSRNDTSIEYISSLKDSYSELTEEANVVAVHVVNSDSAAVVQGIIDSNGLNLCDIPFVQDENSFNAYGNCGGDGAFPMTVVLNVHNEVYSRYFKPLEADEIKSDITKAMDATVYRVGDKLYDFTVDTYESSYKEGSFSTASARGKVLVINFWYVSCGPCIEELPFIEKKQEEFGDRVVTLAIHANNDDVSQAQAFINSENTDRNKASWADWQIIFGQDVGSDMFATRLGYKSYYPITVVVNAEGYITFVRQGKIINQEFDDLTDAIKAALGE